LKKVGEGGFGEVWYALDKRENKQVAVKLVTYPNNLIFLEQGQSWIRARNQNFQITKPVSILR
jgi:serine/threonine protein kinase